MTLLDCALAMGHAETTGLRLKWVNLTSGIVERDGRVMPAHSLAVEANHNRGQWGPPKTKSRRRILPLSRDLVLALRELIEESKLSRSDDAVFGEDGKPIDYSTSLRILKAAGRHAGIGWINWHSLRRFFANISNRLGVPLEERQYILGHTYAAMTQHYTTVTDIERKRPYVEQITRALLGPAATTALPIKSKFSA